MPNAFGLKVRYAMKANSSKAILQLITSTGVEIDASSLNEVKRALLSGVSADKILLTTHEIPLGEEKKELEKLILQGLVYNICSLNQLRNIKEFAAENQVKLSIRVHPGKGTGESSSRNTGDNYSCFGVHLENLPQAIKEGNEGKLIFDQVHVHIGSGGDPEAWKENIDRQLGFVNKYFPQATRVNFGGGFKVGRMPHEQDADIHDLGVYANEKVEGFYKETGRKLNMEIEPGTFVVAKAGSLITKVIDRKKTGKNGFDFVVLDGGMEVSMRPLLYGSQHPFTIISKEGTLISDESQIAQLKDVAERVIVGKCCESGDSQCLDKSGNISPRKMGNPAIGDLVVIGATGAYSSALSPNNYNSHLMPPEVLIRNDGNLQLIRKKQNFEEIMTNEIGL
jgi:diaminopimelate decarboxylase